MKEDCKTQLAPGIIRVQESPNNTAKLFILSTSCELRHRNKHQKRIYLIEKRQATTFPNMEI